MTVADKAAAAKAAYALLDPKLQEFVTLWRPADAALLDLQNAAGDNTLTANYRLDQILGRALGAAGLTSADFYLVRSIPSEPNSFGGIAAARFNFK